MPFPKNLLVTSLSLLYLTPHLVKKKPPVWPEQLLKPAQLLEVSYVYSSYWDTPYPPIMILHAWLFVCFFRKVISSMSKGILVMHPCLILLLKHPYLIFIDSTWYFLPSRDKKKSSSADGKRWGCCWGQQDQEQPWSATHAWNYFQKGQFEVKNTTNHQNVLKTLVPWSYIFYCQLSCATEHEVSKCNIKHLQ